VTRRDPTLASIAVCGNEDRPIAREAPPHTLTLTLTHPHTPAPAARPATLSAPRVSFCRGYIIHLHRSQFVATKTSPTSYVAPPRSSGPAERAVLEGVTTDVSSPSGSPAWTLPRTPAHTRTRGLQRGPECHVALTAPRNNPRTCCEQLARTSRDSSTDVTAPPISWSSAELSVQTDSAHFRCCDNVGFRCGPCIALSRKHELHQHTLPVYTPRETHAGPADGRERARRDLLPPPTLILLPSPRF
jgi:hypothetical protein